RDGPLLLEPGQTEDRVEGIEGAEDQQFLHVEPAVDQGDQIAFLGVEVEAVEVGHELGAQARHGLQSLRMSEKIAHDGVAEDLDVAPQREVARVYAGGLQELRPGMPCAMLFERLTDEPAPVAVRRGDRVCGHAARSLY